MHTPWEANQSRTEYFKMTFRLDLMTRNDICLLAKDIIKRTCTEGLQRNYSLRTDTSDFLGAAILRKNSPSMPGK